jgi:hypothetical protein
MTEPIRYSETLTLQVQPGFRSLIDKAALSAGAKPTEWTRQALREALRAYGIDPADISAMGADDSQRPANGEAA